MDLLRLGKDIYDTRLSMGMSPSDLAACMGWEGTAPVYLIESGKRRPSPETLERLAICLRMSYPTLHYWLGLAGYVIATSLPPLVQIVSILQKVADLIDRYPYPAYILDYQQNFWALNLAAVRMASLAHYSSDKLADLVARIISTLELIFDSRLGFRQIILKHEDFGYRQIYRFKVGNLFRRHEPFYLAYPARMSHLLAEDYEFFQRIWNSIDPQPFSPTFSASGDGMRDFIEIALPGGGVLRFWLVVEKIIYLDGFFEVVRFMPLTGSLPEAKLPLAPELGPSRSVRLWDIRSISEAEAVSWSDIGAVPTTS